MPDARRVMLYLITMGLLLLLLAAGCPDFVAPGELMRGPTLDWARERGVFLGETASYVRRAQGVISSVAIRPEDRLIRVCFTNSTGVHVLHVYIPYRTEIEIIRACS